MTSFSPAWVVELDTRPSDICQRLTVILHGLACLAVWQAGGMPGTWRVLLIVGLVVSGMVSCKGERSRRIRLRDAGEEWWLDTEGRQGMVRLRRGRSWRWLAVMEFRGEWKERPWRQRVVVWPDSVEPDAFRRLRVRLRCAPRASPQSRSRTQSGLIG